MLLILTKKIVISFSQTVDLYFREEDLDLETVMQLLFSLVFTVGIVLALVVVCIPGMGSKRHLLFSRGAKVRNY